MAIPTAWSPGPTPDVVPPAQAKLDDRRLDQAQPWGPSSVWIWSKDQHFEEDGEQHRTTSLNSRVYGRTSLLVVDQHAYGLHAIYRYRSRPDASASTISGRSSFCQESNASEVRSGSGQFSVVQIFEV